MIGSVGALLAPQLDVETGHEHVLFRRLVTPSIYPYPGDPI
jgi:hypothetical protein